MQVQPPPTASIPLAMPVQHTPSPESSASPQSPALDHPSEAAAPRPLAESPDPEVTPAVAEPSRARARRRSQPQSAEPYPVDLGEHGRWTLPGAVAELRKRYLDDDVRHVMAITVSSLRTIPNDISDLYASPPVDPYAPGADSPLVATRISERGGAQPAITPAPAQPYAGRIYDGRGRQLRPSRVAEYIARCPRSQYASDRPPVILWTWERGSPEGARRRVHTCGSWRCDGCCPHSASILFARIREAVAPFGPRDISFWVLTLLRSDYSDVNEAYADLSRRHRNFTARLNRFCKRMGWAPIQSKWVGTCEAHRSGWPHLNILIAHHELAQYLARRYDAAIGLGATDREARLVSEEILRHVVGAGFGPQSTAERARNAEAVNGYICKIAKSHDAGIGEVAKVTQRPDVAAKGFRRYRSGIGFLPPRRRSGYTGCLVSSRIGLLGQPQVHLYSRRSKIDRACEDRRFTLSAEIDLVLRMESATIAPEWTAMSLARWLTLARSDHWGDARLVI